MTSEAPFSRRARPEPNFQTEKELENAIASAVRDAIAADSSVRGLVLPGFGLDLAIFANKDCASRTRFLELKVYAEQNGRCGLGNQSGEGNQIRLLFDEARQMPRDPSQIDVLDSTVRWVLGNRSRPVNSPRFLFFTCRQAQDAAAGGVIRPKKQNNLRLSAFSDLWITWPELLHRIDNFIFM